MTDVPVSQEAVEVTVTDADKEASAELAHAIGMSCEDFTSGGADVIVQAFARRRQQAEREALARMEPVAERYRHKKRGTVYEVIGEAELQMNFDCLVDGSAMVVYRGEDGKLWVREHSEFHDGRFEALPPAPEAGQ